MTDSGVGEIAKIYRRCVRCKGPWNIPLPVRNSDNAKVPDNGGLGLCWSCYDKEFPYDRGIELPEVADEDVKQARNGALGKLLARQLEGE